MTEKFDSWAVEIYRPISSSESWYLAGGINPSNCVAAYAPKGADSLAASYTNLANPGTYDAAPGIAPTWDVVNGWIFNGSTQYLVTGVIPAAGWSAVVKYSGCEDLNGSNAFFGESRFGANFWFGACNITGVEYWNGPSAISALPKLLAGVLAVAGNRAYRNGIRETGTLSSWTSTTNLDIYIGAYNVPNFAYVPYNNIQAVAIYNTTLTNAQVLAVTNAMNDPEWVNVTNDVLQNPHPTWNRGIMSNRPDDRAGSPGYFSFSLRNDSLNTVGLAGYYSPGHVNCWSGWTSGLPVRLSFVFEGITFYKYYGRILPNGIEVDTGTSGPRTVAVRCGDFMWRAAQHELKKLTWAQDKKIGDVVIAVNANMPIPPLAVSIATGVETFPTIFDLVYLRTTALSEYIKAAMSEWSYIYVRGDKTGGETLVVENQVTRSSATLPTLIVQSETDIKLLMETGDFLLNEDGYKFNLDLVVDTNVSTQLILSRNESGFLLNEDGSSLLAETGDKFLLDQVQYALFDNLMLRGGQVSFGKTQANRINSYVYPRRVDASATTVLCSLQKSFMIEAGTTIADYRMSYRDPANPLTAISGISMVAPASGTDYSTTLNEDGTGGDETAHLTVTPAYGTEAVIYALSNNAAHAIWVQILQARGKGVYTYDQVQSVKNNTASQAVHGVIPLSLDFKYQADVRKAQAFSDYVLLKEAWPHPAIESCPIMANMDSMRMFGFLQLEPGTRATFVETQSGINAPYFIMGYTAEIIGGPHVFWNPVLRDDPGYYQNARL